MFEVKSGIAKGKIMIALLPVVGIIFIILIVLSVLAALFGSDTSFYQSFFVLPFDSNTFTITSPYGEREDPITNETSFHNGIDVVPTSHNIVAVADGIVIASEVQELGGESVIIEHRINGQVYRSFYHHLKENSRVVIVGQSVEQGEQIGIMGATGQVTGPHLHFSLQRFSAKDQAFEYTDPSIVITNKINSKTHKLFDYPDEENNQQQQGGLKDPNIPDIPPLIK